MKSKFTFVLFLSISVGSLALQSCQKTGFPKDPTPGTGSSSTTSTMSNGFPNKIYSGRGGASGDGHNGGSTGGGTVTTTDPSLAPSDTTTSQLPVADIITLGKWK